jgi:phosphate transport system substrate-binding protein
MHLRRLIVFRGEERGDQHLVKHRLAISMVTLALFAAACGGAGATPAPASQPSATQPSATQPAATQPSATQPAQSAEASPPVESAGGVPSLNGNVDIHGSSTVAPISQAVSEDLQEASGDFSFVVGDEGTGAGFSEFFCVGQSDISDASRKIRADDPAKEGDEEATVCANNGVNYAELKVGYDGIAVITNINNPIECLTFADLYALFGPESDDVANWNDAEALAHELGSTTDLPDAALSITAPGDESGTYDSFIELALAGFIATQFPDDPATEGNETSDATHLRTPGDVYVASANDNAIIQGVAGFPTSLGFVGMAYAEENTDTVKMIPIAKAADGTCISPTRDTVTDGTYPLSRSLYIYPNLGRAAENPAVVGWVDYYLSDAGIANVQEVGYVPLHPDDLETSRAAWQAARPQ